VKKSTKLFYLISIAGNLLLLFIFAFLIFNTQLFRFSAVEQIPDEIENELVKLGKTALLSMDVPVGAVIVFDGKIIGRGFNTVFRDGNIAGHAEINALNDAIKSFGIDAFLELDKSKLTVYSTYEPCEMCKGTLVHYRINNVKFMKDKGFLRWLKNDRAGIIYELHKKQAGDESIQDSLFRLHPAYPGR
jgi:tRNA(Arg) A34 adenosine deaminase TadA